jgi:hypothetical protein
LNFTFSKSFGQESKKSINLKVENILGSKRESFAESFRSIDQIYTFRDPGLKFSLGYSINL